MDEHQHTNMNDADIINNEQIECNISNIDDIDDTDDNTETISNNDNISDTDNFCVAIAPGSYMFEL